MVFEFPIQSVGSGIIQRHDVCHLEKQDIGRIYELPFQTHEKQTIATRQYVYIGKNKNGNYFILKDVISMDGLQQYLNLIQGIEDDQKSKVVNINKTLHRIDDSHSTFKI